MPHDRTVEGAYPWAFYLHVIVVSFIGGLLVLGWFVLYEALLPRWPDRWHGLAPSIWDAARGPDRRGTPAAGTKKGRGGCAAPALGTSGRLQTQ